VRRIGAYSCKMCTTPAPPKGKGKGDKGKGKGKGEKGKGKGYFQGYCSYCGKQGHTPRDCWTKQKDEASATKMDTNEVSQDSEQEDYDLGGFDIGCIDCEYKVHTHNMFEALRDTEVNAVDSTTLKGEVTIDSGAAESVWPVDLIPHIPTVPSEGSRKGVNYISASGQKIPNKGEKKVRFKTINGKKSSITFQVAQVRKPLASVARIVDKGNVVVFGPKESYIQNIKTQEKVPVERRNGTYHIDVEYLIEEEGFHRQP